MATAPGTTFGAHLKRLRLAAGLTQEALAERARLSAKAVSDLERQPERTPRLETVTLLADALGLDREARSGLLAAARPESADPATVAAGERSEPAPAHPSLPPRAIGSMAPAVTAFHPTPVLGRTQELELIRQLLVDGTARLLTLIGPAGVGKTRLALEVAAQLAADTDRFPDGVLFVDLTPVRDPALVLGSLAGAIGLLDIGNRPVLERLVAVLEARQQLVLLDNFEQILPAAASLTALLAACPGLVLLVTSRVPLQLRWERVVRVAPLPVPDLAAPLPPLDELAAIPSVALFVQRARARQPEFLLTETQASVIARLVGQLDGLPLALELAAVRTATLPLPVIANRLGDRLRLLQWEAADVPERQRSLEAAVGWSYDLLTQEEQRLFRCLGVFVGRVSLDAITAVATAVARPVAGQANAADDDGGRTLDGLLSLAEQSLLLPARPTDLGWQHGGAEDEADDGQAAEPAFRMLETVREYARERLAAAGELEAARRGHARYFLALAERAAPLLHEGGQRAWYMRLEQEQDNMRATLRWLLDQDDPAEREAGLRLAGALGWFWAIRHYHAEGRRWLEEALVRAPEADPAVRLRALLAVGRVLMLQGDVVRARTVLEEALALAEAERRQYPPDIARALTLLGLRAVLAGELAEGTRHLNEARRLWEALGAPHGLGLTLYYLGFAADAMGDAADAAAQYVAALRWLDTAGDAQFAGVVHSYLGVAAWKLGELPRAVAQVRAGVETGVALRDRHLVCLAAQAAVALAGARVDPVGRARLLGAADALGGATGATFVWDSGQGGQEVAGLREGLVPGEGAVAAAYREGRSLPFGAVAGLVLTLLEEIARTLSPHEAEPAGAKQPEPRSRRGEQGPLSAREAEVLRLVAQGHSSKAIGRQLYISERTVAQHVHAVFNKLGVNTRAQAVAVAAQRGLL